MSSQYIRALEGAVSTERLSGYRRTADNELDAAVNYFYNVVLAEALYSSLSALEVTLRNSIHNAAQTEFGTPFWFDQPGVLKQRQPASISDARLSLQRQGKAPTDGRIVAELNFGFWTTLLSGPYHSAFWMPRQARMLKAAFPHMTNRERQRQQIFYRCNHLRLLRNRVFHFEPIWNRRDLLGEYQDILQTIGWMNSTMHGSVIALDNFPDVHSHGQVRVETGIKRQLNLFSG